MTNETDKVDEQHFNRESDSAVHSNAVEELPKEIGGQKGPEPTRYGDWEKNGRCTDF